MALPPTAKSSHSLNFFKSSTHSYQLLSESQKAKVERRISELHILIRETSTPLKKVEYSLEREQLIRSLYESTAGYAKRDLHEVKEKLKTIQKKQSAQKRKFEELESNHNTAKTEAETAKRTCKESQQKQKKMAQQLKDIQTIIEKNLSTEGNS